MPIFRVKSVKIYTGQKKIYMDIVCASVTNMRMVQAGYPVEKFYSASAAAADDYKNSET